MRNILKLIVVYIRLQKNKLFIVIASYCYEMHS